MKTRVQKWGNSLALRIPKSFATEAGLCENTAVDLSVTEEARGRSTARGAVFPRQLALCKITDRNSW